MRITQPSITNTIVELNLDSLGLVSMWISAAFLLFALAINAVTSDEIGRRCPTDWDKFGTQCFKFFKEPKTWAEAEQQCVELGGNLVSIKNQIVFKYLKSFVKKQDKNMPRTWIGAHDATQAFIWFWSDGTKFEFNDWHTGEPNNGGGNERCVELAYGAEQRWNDARCDSRLSFICYRVARISL